MGADLPLHVGPVLRGMGRGASTCAPRSAATSPNAGTDCGGASGQCRGYLARTTHGTVQEGGTTPRRSERPRCWCCDSIAICVTRPDGEHGRTSSDAVAAIPSGEICRTVHRALVLGTGLIIAGVLPGFLTAQPGAAHPQRLRVRRVDAGARGGSVLRSLRGLLDSLRQARRSHRPGRWRTRGGGRRCARSRWPRSRTLPRPSLRCSS